MDISNLSKEERAELLHALKKQEKEDSINRREAYETLRHQFAFDVESKLMPVVNNVAGFREWLESESGAFRNVMRDYGQLRRGEEQASFSVVDGNFKLGAGDVLLQLFADAAPLGVSVIRKYNHRKRIHDLAVQQEV